MEIVKVICSSAALLAFLREVGVLNMDENEIVEIEVSQGFLLIGNKSLMVEHKGIGQFQSTGEKLQYLRTIIRHLKESPIVLVFSGDHIYLTDIYIG